MAERKLESLVQSVLARNVVVAGSERIGTRLAASDSSAVLGFDNRFFALTPATAAGILVAFTVVELFAAVLLLMRRPAVNP